MRVHVEASGILKEQISPDLTVKASSVGEAVSQLDLRDAGEVLFLVNGRMARWQTKLQDGDRLKLVPAIGGGAHAARSMNDNFTARELDLKRMKPLKERIE